MRAKTRKSWTVLLSFPCQDHFCKLQIQHLAERICCFDASLLSRYKNRFSCDKKINKILAQQDRSYKENPLCAKTKTK